MSKEISDSKIKLRDIQDDITKNREINEELEQKIIKNKPFFSNSENQKKKINEELEQRKKELEILNKRLGGIKKTHIKNEGSDDSKNVVEAASQIIATTNKRLHDTMKELDVIRQLLDKERRAHNETKKKLQD
jgi:phage-related tail protein